MFDFLGVRRQRLIDEAIEYANEKPSFARVKFYLEREDKFEIMIRWSDYVNNPLKTHKIEIDTEQAQKFLEVMINAGYFFNEAKYFPDPLDMFSFYMDITNF